MDEKHSNRLVTGLLTSLSKRLVSLGPSVFYANRPNQHWKGEKRVTRNQSWLDWNIWNNPWIHEQRAMDNLSEQWAHCRPRMLNQETRCNGRVTLQNENGAHNWRKRDSWRHHSQPVVARRRSAWVCTRKHGFYNQIIVIQYSNNVSNSDLSVVACTK
jgi:hypothetical protein